MEEEISGASHRRIRYEDNQKKVVLEAVALAVVGEGCVQEMSPPILRGDNQKKVVREEVVLEEGGECIHGKNLPTLEEDNSQRSNLWILEEGSHQRGQEGEAPVLEGGHADVLVLFGEGQNPRQGCQSPIDDQCAPSLLRPLLLPVFR